MFSGLSRNVFSVFFGRGITLTLNFLIIAIAARKLGVEDFGLFTSTLALITIISKLIDFGLAQIVFRETSKAPDNFVFVNTSITIRLLLFLVTIISYNIYSYLLNINQVEVILSNIFFINIIISSRFMIVRDLFETIFKVRLEMHYVMLLHILDHLLLLLTILLLPFIATELLLFAATYSLANLPGFVALLVLLKTKLNFRFHFSLKNGAWIIKEALPLLGFVIISTVYIQIDVLILKNFDSVYSAGIFSAAFRITMPLSIIPVALVSSIFPVLVKNINTNEKSNELIIKLVHKSLFMFSVFFALIIFFKSKEITSIVFGPDYIFASEPLNYLLFSYVFLFFNFFSLDVFTAYGKQKINLIYSILITITNILILFIILDSASYISPGLSKLISAGVGTLYIVLMQKKLHQLVKFISVKFILSLIIVGISFNLCDYFTIYIYLPLTLFLVMLSIKHLPFFTVEEIHLIKEFTGNNRIINFFLIEKNIL